MEPPRLRDTNGRDMATCTRVCLYQQSVTWIFTRLRLSDPFIENNYFIIAVFHTHISAFMIYFIRKGHLF